MKLASGRLLLVALLASMLAACQTSGEGDASVSGGPDGSAAPVSTAATQPARNSNERYFIEFRSRYAYSYGHSYVIFGRLDRAGKMIDPEVAGLAPKSDDPSVYVLGHFAPVPSSTGWTDGDLEDEYKSASWRVMLTKAEYDKVVKDIRKLQASSPVWHAALYNCNAFVADIARSMGYKTPFIWARPQQFITNLRKMNAGKETSGAAAASSAG